jgi:hypothetical protein
MSGTDVPEVLIGGAESRAVAELLEVLGPLTRELAVLERALVLVGGLAVAVRVASADRATTDIDSVFDLAPDDSATIEVLAAAGVGEPAGPAAPQRRVVNGVGVDCIDTYAIDDAELADMGDRDALFVGAHRFAAVTAEPVRLRVGDRAVETLVAIPGALVATKLHAARYRPHSDKLGGDLLDLYQLLTRCDNVAMADALSHWPRLGGLVRDGVGDVFIAHASRAAGQIHSTGVTRVGDADLRAAAELFVHLLA